MRQSGVKKSAVLVYDKDLDKYVDWDGNISTLNDAGILKTTDLDISGLLTDILVELKKLNIQMSLQTDEEITNLDTN